MSNTGTDIRVKAFPRMTNAQIAAIAGILLLTPAGGLVIGRVTSPRNETNRRGIRRRDPHEMAGRHSGLPGGDHRG